MGRGVKKGTFEPKKLQNLQKKRKKTEIGMFYILYKRIKLCYNFTIMIFAGEV